ncbi:hypothetical protein RHSIM_Rhsim09G0160300 [Rhododendron simsii]|uniref:Uncharacterized protein n=1 Tax=Rhododendron simsii TaxID=118357 RepID=A0A834GJQ3_RHOSS|nr:hypothetical protein RHSIM_Rhsim09G0160300 [Rhododendron simsii]
MATSSKTKVSLKLLIDTNGKRVLYPEASKDFVDFLFNLLRLTVGAVVEVLKKQTMVGTLGNLFESIENLNETYFQPNTSKQSLLKGLLTWECLRVLFAEAGKDFVDFLFTLLSLPVSTVVRLLTAKSMVGCLGNLYDSVENLSDTCMLPNQSKEVLLKPKVAVRSTEASLLLTDDDAPVPAVNKMYKCGSCNGSVGFDPKATCPLCKYSLSIEVTFVPSKDANTGLSGEEGYVNRLITYMVMDDLVVIPMSTISGIELLTTNVLQFWKIGFGMVGRVSPLLEFSDLFWFY